MNSSKNLIAVAATGVAILAALFLWQRGSSPRKEEAGKPVSHSSQVDSGIPSGHQESNRAGGSSAASADQKLDLPDAESLRDFEELVAEARKNLATRDELRQLDAHAAHRFPKPLMRSAAALGRVAEAVKKNPALASTALEFYAECALSNALAQSVRALCLARHDYHRGSEPSSLRNRVPSDLIRLAEQARFVPTSR